MKKILEFFKSRVFKSVVEIENDGYIGVPVNVAVLYDEKTFGSVKPGAGGTPIILYVLNTAVERIGMASDTEIISSMLYRGYAVILLDYKNNPRAISPALDYSVQALRQRIIDEKEGDELSFFGEEKYLETFVVPAGYDVDLSKPYWAFDRHGADGILEKITEIWNNDFKGTNAERLVKWTDEKGNKKKTVTATDGSEPFWCNSKGEEDKNGEYVKLKYTYAESITDCVKPNGDPIDLNLYMHFIYPVKPNERVPVMCLSSSTEHLANGSASKDRPHLNGFLFRGYAGVMFDYGYTPMARVDHYGYFDGYPKAGYVTGDNATYSMSFYNDKRIFSAAIRYIRYLALSDEKFAFDIDAIGVYGNSKGSWMTFLGEENPEKLTSKRILAGHHDETRFEVGNTETVGLIRGGEEQPWMENGEIAIKSRADLIYSSTGGLDESITEGHCPMFISSNRRDSSCYSTSNTMYAACRNHNVPVMNVDVNLPHTIVYSDDLVFGVDAYKTFFDFCGYFLKHDAVKVVGIKANCETLPYSVSVRFSGSVEKEEIEKITVNSGHGERVNGEWRGYAGGIDWIFIPNELKYYTEYTVTVPATLSGNNGKSIGENIEFKFISPKTTRVPLASSVNGDRVNFNLPKAKLGRKYIEFKVSNDGVGKVSLLSDKGEKLTFANVCGKGTYRINVTDFALDNACLKISSEDKTLVAYESDFKNSMSGFSSGGKSKCRISFAPDGTEAIEMSGFETITEHPSEEFYSYPNVALILDKIAGDKPMTSSDMGRKFSVSFKLYDTASRYVKVAMSHATSMEKSIIDYRRFVYNVVTKAGEWVDVNFDFDVYEFMYSEFEDVQKTMTLSCYGFGVEDKPLYLADVKSEEKLSPIEISDVCFITEEEPKDVFPEGKCDIICKKSPWQK